MRLSVKFTSKAKDSVAEPKRACEYARYLHANPEVTLTRPEVTLTSHIVTGKRVRGVSHAAVRASRALVSGVPASRTLAQSHSACERLTRITSICLQLTPDALIPPAPLADLP